MGERGRRVVTLMMAVVGLCQILTITGPAGKLKNEKLTTRPLGPSLPGFQVFTPPDAPEILYWVEVWEGNVLNVLKPGPLGLANIRCRQMATHDPKQKFTLLCTPTYSLRLILGLS